MEKSNYFNGLTKYWWIILLSGLVFIGFGVWCLCDPSASLPLMAYIFAGIIGAVGIFNLIYGICNVSSYGGAGWALAGGIIEILFSIFLFFIPASILTWVFIYGVGIYIIFMTIYAICDSFMMSRYSTGWFAWFLILLIAALVFACIFILGPIGGAVAAWLYIGISFLCWGVYRVLLAIKICEVNKNFK